MRSYPPSPFGCFAEDLHLSSKPLSAQPLKTVCLQQEGNKRGINASPKAFGGRIRTVLTLTPQQRRPTFRAVYNNLIWGLGSLWETAAAAAKYGGQDKAALLEMQDVLGRMADNFNILNDHVEHFELQQNLFRHENNQLRRQLEIGLERQRELEVGLLELNARLGILMESRSRQKEIKKKRKGPVHRLKDWLKRDYNISTSRHSLNAIETIVRVWQGLTQPERWVLRPNSNLDFHLVYLRSTELKEEKRKWRIAQREKIHQRTLMWEDVIADNKENRRNKTNRLDVRTSTWPEPSTDQEGLTSVMEEILLQDILKMLGDDVLEEKIQQELDEIIQELEEMIEEKEWAQQKNPDGDETSIEARKLQWKKKELKARRKAEKKKRKLKVKSRIFRAWNEMQDQKQAEKEWRKMELFPIIEIEKDLGKAPTIERKKNLKRDMKLEEKERRAQRRAEGARKREELRHKIIQEELEREKRKKSARERRRQALREIMKREKKPARKNEEVSQVSNSLQEGFDKSIKELPLMEYASLLLRKPRLFHLPFKSSGAGKAKRGKPNTESQETSEIKRSQGTEEKRTEPRPRLFHLPFKSSGAGKAKRGKPNTESQETSEIKRSQGTEGKRTELRLVQVGNKWQIWRKVGCFFVDVKTSLVIVLFIRDPWRFSHLLDGGRRNNSQDESHQHSNCLKEGGQALRMRANSYSEDGGQALSG
ncbi:trichohyalin-like [Macrobrachium nipponense]|uniref:trichohyalin-like n=1 Tax=Macrobrachium nipponense TaxID=159736 RepID=UPI0030C8861E